jgi:hypothetical protein
MTTSKKSVDAKPMNLVAGTAAAAAATTASGEAAGRAGRAAAGACRGEDGELDGGLFAGTLGAGDFLLLVDDDFFEALVADVADVFVDGHGWFLNSEDKKDYSKEIKDRDV